MDYGQKRKQMVDQLKDKGIIQSQIVYDAMINVPRHEFVPEKIRKYSYEDRPLSIGKGQTISAPHMNAMMCELLDLSPEQNILEIGTGSGYHASLLAFIVGKSGCVITIERFKKLASKAKQVFTKLNYSNIKVICRDGTLGCKEFAPFDRILITAAGPKIIENLINQLNTKDGKMCVPIGKRNGNQSLYLIEKKLNKIKKRKVCDVIFVPLIGENGFN